MKLPEALVRVISAMLAIVRNLTACAGKGLSCNSSNAAPCITDLYNLSLNAAPIQLPCQREYSVSGCKGGSRQCHLFPQRFSCVTAFIRFGIH